MFERTKDVIYTIFVQMSLSALWFFQETIFVVDCHVMLSNLKLVSAKTSKKASNLKQSMQ